LIKRFWHKNIRSSSLIIIPADTLHMIGKNFCHCSILLQVMEHSSHQPPVSALILQILFKAGDVKKASLLL